MLFSIIHLWQLKFQALFQAFPCVISYAYKVGGTVRNIHVRKLRIKDMKVAQTDYLTYKRHDWDSNSGLTPKSYNFFYHIICLYSTVSFSF